MAVFIPVPTLSNLQGTLPVTKGGTNKTSWVLGSIPYASATNVLNEANSTFWYDGALFGIGTTRTGAVSGTNPVARVKGTGATSATGAADWQNSAGTELFAIRNDGQLRVLSSNTGYAYSTAGVISYDSSLAYINNKATLVLTDSNFRLVQSSNPAWIGSGRSGELGNNGTVGGFRTLIEKNITANDSNIDAYTAFRILVSAGSGIEDGKSYATFQTNSGEVVLDAGGVLVSALRLQTSGDGHFTRNLCIGDSGLTSTFGSNGTAVLMLVQGTSPTGNGTGLQLWWDGTNLKYRTPSGTVGNLI